MLNILARLRKTATKVINLIFGKRKSKKDDDDPYGLNDFKYPLF